MTFRLVEHFDNDFIDDGCVSEVDWVNIEIPFSTFGDRQMLMFNTNQICNIEQNKFKILKIFIHPESDAIWMYCIHIDSMQKFEIHINNIYEYNYGIN